MEFLKKHYEKLILSVVLLALAGVAGWLTIKVREERDKEEVRKSSLIGAAVKELPPVNLSTNEAILQKVKTPIKFDIAGKHNLFNPVPWVKGGGGELIKVQTGDEIGMGALQVTAINPLQMIVTFDQVVGAAPDFKYEFTIIREGDRSPKQGRALSLGLPTSFGSLKSIQGPPEAPTSLTLQLPDRSEVTVSKDKPFSKVIGYSAELFYKPANNWTKKGVRKGDPVVLPGVNESYNVVAIDKDTVVFSAKSNNKQTPKKVATK